MHEPTDANPLIAERREKLARLRASGETAFPNNFKPRDRACDLLALYAARSREELDGLAIEVALAGRMMLKRVQGKASFATLQDGADRIQIWMNDEGLGALAHEAFKHWDIGDIVAVEGRLFRTMKGELSVRAARLRLLCKSLRPLPDKFHGLADQETRYRQRYVDLIVNQDSRATFLRRSKLTSILRTRMTEAGFLEVETPMMQPIPGGAVARPFKTHHNALELDMYLRVAPELYLKRLIVGGFDRVFEINRNFRNEGISTRHNPEFTMMEFYAAFTDYRWLMDFTETLLRETAQQVCGTLLLPYQGRTLDLSKPFARMTIVDAIRSERPAWDEAALHDEAFLRAQLRAASVDVESPALRSAPAGVLQLALFEACAESAMWHPVFIVDYPVEASPLARESDTHEGITERFELFIAGREIANGFSELNDPEDQARRFQAQAAAKAGGDEEAMFFDADYIRALEYGMPPTGGCGIGIDRLTMLLTNTANIRDVILFPTLRPEGTHKDFNPT
jgi:lysyl-tRNA synthetase class 2